MAFGGLAVIFLVAGVRLSLTQSGASNLKVIVLPDSAKRTPPINALIDEQDSVLFGERLFHLVGGVSSREHKDIVSSLSTAYQEVRRANGVFASPFASTYLGLQTSTAFDAIVIEPTLEQPAQAGVIFLHGFMGNVTVQCWQIAQAVDKIGAVTVCPSTGWVGDWWTPEGEAILQATFHYLRERGLQRLYLGGFSNGASGVGSLIPTLRSTSELHGLFFIAGGRNATAVRETGLPVLVILGVDDERIPVENMRRFAEEIGEQGTFVEINSDHFLIMKQPRLVQEALFTWLEDQESNR